MDREKAEKVYLELYEDFKNSTIYNSDLEDETIKFYQKYPEVFIKSKRNIINDFIKNKEKIINDLMKNEE